MLIRLSLAAAVFLPLLSGCQTGNAGLFLEGVALSVQEQLRPAPSDTWRLETPEVSWRRHDLPSPAPLGALVESSDSVCWLHIAPQRLTQDDPCSAPGAIKAKRLNPEPAPQARFLVFSRMERRAGPYTSFARFEILPERRFNAAFDLSAVLAGQSLSRSRLSLMFSSPQAHSFPNRPYAPDPALLTRATLDVPGVYLVYEPPNLNAKPRTYVSGSEYYYPLLTPRLLAMQATEPLE